MTPLNAGLLCFCAQEEKTDKGPHLDVPVGEQQVDDDVRRE